MNLVFDPLRVVLHVNVHVFALLVKVADLVSEEVDFELELHLLEIDFFAQASDRAVASRHLL